MYHRGSDEEEAAADVAGGGVEDETLWEGVTWPLGVTLLVFA